MTITAPAQTDKYRDTIKIRINKRNRKILRIRKRELRKKKGGGTWHKRSNKQELTNN
jgi:hypothetical protein